jgi:hypothetical protein
VTAPSTFVAPTTGGSFDTARAYEKRLSKAGSYFFCANWVQVSATYPDVTLRWSTDPDSWSSTTFTK